MLCILAAAELLGKQHFLFTVIPEQCKVNNVIMLVQTGGFVWKNTAQSLGTIGKSILLNESMNVLEKIASHNRIIMLFVLFVGKMFTSLLGCDISCSFFPFLDVSLIMFVHF